ncbi:hypothetical protein AC477_05575 [miscellaneous Crenarchaeota group-1 archaeon SG8-32-1]|uniref:Uncharacterized protein n=1 Tax=miscellaneous Crenarchaeota group-1 archaeon SG8-32-1 TaxID=1685124 RepID=A0A0M0BN37_9ARCH|nr:MAG: hypothetical protein AC477_05575 [miscellaneous Crenarchaeota group-1 archaeon SG8-32-1]
MFSYVWYNLTVDTKLRILNVSFKFLVLWVVSNLSTNIDFRLTIKKYQVLTTEKWYGAGELFIPFPYLLCFLASYL